MGELSDTLNEYHEISRRYYQKIMEILEDKYCWKCPMRINSKEALCREVDAWIRLTESMEMGVREKLDEDDFSIEELEVLTAKFLEKSMKTTEKNEKHLIIKAEYDAEPYAHIGDFIFARTHPLRVKAGDMVLLPRACPLATYQYIKTFKQATVPFKIYRVTRVFEKGGIRFIETEDGLEVPVEYLLGVVNSIMGNPDLSIQNPINKN